MDLSTFLHERRPDWRRLEELLGRVEGSGLGSLEEEQAVEFGRLYRRAASDLNQAQTFVSGDATVRYLNDLVARAYLVIYRKTRIDLRGLLVYLVWGYPAVFRRYLGHFLVAAALFTAGAVFGYLAGYHDTDMARSFLLPAEMSTVEPRAEGRDDPTPQQSTGQFAAFSSFLFTHNLSVSLTVFALGMTLGVGTAWLLFTNGIFMGVLAAIFVKADRLTQYATDVLPHGVLEIPAVLIAGAAGLMLGQGILRARPWPRREEIAPTAGHALLMVFGCAPLLIFAGGLEAGVARAPERVLSQGVKLAVAGVFALLFVAYVVLLGWGRHATRGVAE
jgi:uncharacterized membrane protein SpoIIM required for sporulation